MIQTFQCPNCRASLEYDPDAHPLTVRCDFCGSTVIVPETLRRPGSVATTAAATGEQSEALREVVRLVQAGQKIHAIAEFRRAFDVTLAEGKAVVEAIERQEAVRIGTATLDPSEYGLVTRGPSSAGGRRGCIIVSALIVVVIGALIPLVIGGGLGFVGAAERGSDRPSSQATAASVAALATSFAFEPVTPTRPSADVGLATVVQEFGGREGTGPGFFNDTRRLGIDGEGHIYTGDYSGGRIQAFDADGTFRSQFTLRDDLYMVAMTVDRQGTVFVADRDRVRRFEGLTGRELEPLAGASGYVRSLGATVDGGVIAYSPDRLVRFDRDGQVTLDVPIDTEMRTTHEDVAVDGAGNIYVLGSEAIFKFDSNGRFLTRLGSAGDGPDQFRTSPTAIAVDGRGRLFACDFDGIKVYDGNGRFLGLIEMRGVAFDMVVNDQDELLVMERNGNRVLRYAFNE